MSPRTYPIYYLKRDSLREGEGTQILMMGLLTIGCCAHLQFQIERERQLELSCNSKFLARGTSRNWLDEFGSLWVFMKSRRGFSILQQIVYLGTSCTVCDAVVIRVCRCIFKMFFNKSKYLSCIGFAEKTVRSQYIGSNSNFKWGWKCTSIDYHFIVHPDVYG